MFSELSKNEIDLRRNAMQAAMKQAGVDALLLSTNANLYYSSGRVFAGYTYVPSEGELIYFVRRPVGLQDSRIEYIRKPEQIPGLLMVRGVVTPKTLAIESDSVPFTDYMRLASVFSGSELSNGSQIMRKVRSVKTAYETDLVRQSGAKHSDVYRKIESVYIEDMSDVELCIEIERIMRLHGNLGIFRINGSSMEIFMGSLLCGDNADNPSPYDFAMGGAGLNPSLPVSCNGTLIKPGMTVMVDMGGNFTGYMTDMTRVFYVGDIPMLAKKAHQVSIDIHNEIMKMAKPGVPASQLYDLALNMAKSAGLEDYFMGYTQKAGFVGHGVGIEVNEAPVLAPRSKDILEEGNVIALEPKFVIPHVGAVGIENTYVVNSDGIEKLTHFKEELIPLF